MNMRRNTNFAEEKADCQETNKKISKNVSDCVRKVDSITSSVKSCGLLFTPQAISSRQRLRDVCEKSFLNGDLGIQRSNIEEALWKKAFYEPFSQAKRLRKVNSWSVVEAAIIWNHLNDGIMFYQNLLLFFASHDRHEPHNLDFFPSDDQLVDVISNENSFEYLQDSVFRCLICLGDLTRYCLDLPMKVFRDDAALLSMRYYHQALHYNPESGLTHSNLAAVFALSNEPLLATLHYLRAITSNKPFVGAEGNLRRLLDKSKIWLDNKKATTPATESSSLEQDSQKFLHTCLVLVSGLVTNRGTEGVAVLCQDVLVQLGKLLDNYDNEILDGSESSVENGPTIRNKQLITSYGANFLLNPETMVVLSAVFIICSKRLELLESPQSNMSEILIVCILQTLVTHINTRLEQRFSSIDPYFIEKLLPVQEPDKKDTIDNKKDPEIQCNGTPKAEKKKSKLAKLRRRKVQTLDKGSDTNGFNYTDGSQNSSDEESLGSSSENEEDYRSSSLCTSEDDSDSDVKLESDEEWDGLTPKEHLDLISREGMVGAVYVILNWLSAKQELVQLWSKEDENLWPSLVKFFNLIHVNADGLDAGKIGIEQKVLDVLQPFRKGPPSSKGDCHINLPEDLKLHLVLRSFTADSSKKCSSTESNAERIRRLNALMSDLVNKGETPIIVKDGKLIAKKLDKKEKVTRVEDKEKSPTEALEVASHKKSRQNNGPKLSTITSGMRALASQWINHEVRNLESQTQAGGLYLVPDTAVFLNHLLALKKMIMSPTHMIIVPISVMDALDLQKKECVAAREASRWLDSKLHHGSRFIRAQRPHEKTKIPLLKYPKRKDKDALHWFNVAECCHYLGRTQIRSNPSLKKSTVTLLTGEDTTKISQMSFSVQALSDSAGSVLQNIDDFVKKWQVSTKGRS